VNTANYNGGYMKNSFTIAVATVMLSGAGATAADLPTFEALGLPITQHQVAVLGAAHVQERSAVPTLTLGGMPASPVQIAVLTPRAKEVAAANPTRTGPSTP
jgi:hypothetical protein